MINRPSSQRPRLRFAPSPNGELHLGHAYSALKTWELAERWGGDVILRIEDIDIERTREEFVAGIHTDLAWLGLEWPEPVRRQSDHFDDYRLAANELRTRKLLFPCTATRKQIAEAVASRANWPTDPDGAPLYPGIAKSGDDRVASDAAFPLNAGAALRLDMQHALRTVLADDPLTAMFCDELEDTTSPQPLDASVWGDAVIVRKDTPTSYHLSVVIDDALQGVTHVTRGKDLEAATGLHVLLQRLLDLPTPVYHHHDLITDSSGRKLSKSLRDTSLRHLRKSGWTPDDVREAVGFDSGPKV